MRIALVLVVFALLPAYGQTPKRGGILNAMQGEDLPAGFSLHETATIFGHSPIYNFARMQDVWLDR